MSFLRKQFLPQILLGVGGGGGGGFRCVPFPPCMNPCSLFSVVSLLFYLSVTTCQVLMEI